MSDREIKSIRTLRSNLTFLSLIALTAVSSVLAGCGGGDKNDPAPDDEPQPLPASFIVAPPLTVAPRLVGMSSDIDSSTRGPVIALGSIVAPSATGVAFDGPRITRMANDAVVNAGGLLDVELAWDDLGSDVDSLLIELRCVGGTSVTQVHAIFDALELFGLPDDLTTFSFRVDPSNQDAGYEIVVVLRDAQGNLSSAVRSAFLVTQFGGDAAFGAATANLFTVGGENPPQLGTTQVWMPTGGTVNDSVPNGLEGSFPTRVSGDVPIYVQQQPGANLVAMTDVGTGDVRRGAIYGDLDRFTYLFCSQGVSIDSDCGGIWATVGVGTVIEEFRLGRLDKRLEINEVRVLIGSFDPLNPGAGITPPAGPDSFGCPGAAFPFRLINEFVVFVR